MSPEHEVLVRTYQDKCSLHTELVRYLEGFLADLCKQNIVNAHAIHGRLKSLDSFVGKIQRPEKNYKSLGEIHDVAGVRIILYLNEHVDTVAKLVEKEFKIQADHSSDRRAAPDPERFGYRSLHYVVELKESRLRLEQSLDSPAAKIAGSSVSLEMRSSGYRAAARSHYRRGIVRPPSILTTWPVEKGKSPRARPATALPMSPGTRLRLALRRGKNPS